jgi:threonine dehydrogenase-like Zn-dependent dehydrogenase
MLTRLDMLSPFTHVLAHTRTHEVDDDDDDTCIRTRLQVPDLVNEYMQGTTLLDKYITHRLPFSQINEAFELLHAGECLRVVLSFD